MLQIVYGMIVFICILGAAPCFIGDLACRGISGSLRRSFAYRYVAGFMAMLALWSVMALFFMLVLPFHPFHELRYAYLAVLILLCVISICLLIRDGVRPKDLFLGFRMKLSAFSGSGSDRVYIVVFLVIVLFQLFNTMFFAPKGYVQDDLWYYAYINDNVYLDQLYAKNAWNNGAFPSKPVTAIVQTVGFKQIVAQWYAFVSFIAASTHIRPIIICRTLMPAFLILAVYITTYVFASYCYNGDPSGTRVFMACAAFIMETFSYTYYLFHLTVYVTTWGKPVAGMIGIPFLLLTAWAAMGDDDTGSRHMWRHAVMLFMISVGTASLTFASIVAGSAGLFCFMAAAYFRYRRKDAILYAVAGEIPYAAQLLLYVILTH